jgi:solute carrier family 35 (GDP-fucose transporter), member C1
LEESKESLFKKYLRIFTVVTAYWLVTHDNYTKLYHNIHHLPFFRVVSILTVFVNKALLSSKSVNLEAPLFVTWYQCLFSATICFTMSKLADTFPKHIWFPKGNPWNWETFIKVRKQKTQTFS